MIRALAGDTSLLVEVTLSLHSDEDEIAHKQCKSTVEAVNTLMLWNSQTVRSLGDLTWIPKRLMDPIVRFP